MLRCSTHDLGLSEAIELSRRLGTLPARLVAYGIEGSDFGHGRGLSPFVACAVESLAHEIEGQPAWSRQYMAPRPSGS